MEYWNYLKQKINSNDNMFTFGRTQEVQDNYMRFKSNISDIYAHLMESLFKNNEDLVFKKNDFPYKFDCENGNIIHYLIWINPNNKKKINMRKINKFLSENILRLDSNILDYIIFKNNIVNKSVDTIDHYHVLFRLK